MSAQTVSTRRSRDRQDITLQKVSQGLGWAWSSCYGRIVKDRLVSRLVAAQEHGPAKLLRDGRRSTGSEGGRSSRSEGLEMKPRLCVVGAAAIILIAASSVTWIITHDPVGLLFTGGH